MPGEWGSLFIGGGKYVEGLTFNDVAVAAHILRRIPRVGASGNRGRRGIRAFLHVRRLGP